MLLGTEIGDLATTRLVILAVVNAYALSRGLICVVRALAGPFGLFRVRAETAAYIEIWARRIVTVGVSGIAFANVALLLGLHRAGYAALLRLVMLIVHLFIVVIILQCRRQVAQAIRAPAGREGLAARMRNRVAGLWHYLAIALDVALWAVWALNIRNGYSLLLQYFLGATRSSLITRLATIVVLSLIDRGFRIRPGDSAALPGPGDPCQLAICRSCAKSSRRSSPSSASLHCLKSGVWMPSSGSTAARSAAGCCRRL